MTVRRGAGRFALALTLVLGVAGSSSPATPRRDLPEVRPNDNRVPAGRLEGDTLHLSLVVQMARWHPEAADGPSVDVEAFAEDGKAPEIPGPLIRVREGTVIDATVRNDLADSTITVHGLYARPAEVPDSLVLKPGESGRVRFQAGAPGTYFYFATLGAPAGRKEGAERETMAGAFIVDPAGGSPPDRIFVMNIWEEPIDSLTYSSALTINGRSFPHSERIETVVGDTLHWRWINASLRQHPMHLHGFYYLVDSRGNALTDSVYAPDARRLVVTEAMQPLTTMAMTWSAAREGNWLFHCHIGFHVVPEARLVSPAPHAHDNHSGDATKHMAGLVLGIYAKVPPGWREPARGVARQVRMHVQEGKPRGHAPRALSFVFQRGETPPAPDSVDIPGQPLILTRDEPTDVTIINHLREATAVHWHGLELESWSDGVAGWSGIGKGVAPAIQPGDSFVARLSHPRAGTFIYHTHLNDFEQLTSGLYGGMIVLEPGERFDPATDHLYVAGWDGPGDAGDPRVVNGDTAGPPVEWQRGVPHRLRFVNVGMAAPVRFTMYRDSTPTRWRARAKDGADLPPSQATERAASVSLNVGMTVDVTFLPTEPGEYRLVVPGFEKGKARWSQPIIVK
ncbi:MAG: multicopper oxidase domain-containing protein [Gemmatimonadota bacterium]|nr:multicopper oxidase domain-containing protein [Gemmatimonadota bacterium]MDH5284086.1 multicopper oxidase domain-containing protein [Gemmatimonadota bacterium]